MSDKRLKLCPYRAHGEMIPSATVEGEHYYNEYFMPCIGKECVCYIDLEDYIVCRRGQKDLILWAKDTMKRTKDDGEE